MVHLRNLTKGRPLHAGEVVLVRVTTLKVRGRYPLGVVETAKETRTNDNIVRSAIIRIPPIDGRKEKLITRPLELIAPFEITDTDIPHI